jgi:hypothetical protein
MYTSVDFTSQIARQRGVPCPTNKRISYTNLVSGLTVTLKINYYYYYYYQRYDYYNMSDWSYFIGISCSI